MARELPVWLARPFCCQIEINPMRDGESFVSSGLCQSTCLEVQRVIYGIVLSSQYDICQYDVISEIFELRMAMHICGYISQHPKYGSVSAGRLMPVLCPFS